MALIDLASRIVIAGKDIQANFGKFLSTSTDVQNVKFGTLETTGNATLGGNVSIPNGDLYTVALTTYTPTVAVSGGGTSPVYSTVVGNYKMIGNTVFFEVYLEGDGGADGAGAGNLSITPPVNIRSGIISLGTGKYKNGAVNDGVIVLRNSATEMLFRLMTTGNGNLTGDDQNNTARQMIFSGSYEAA